jgi:hypothetical protein
MAMAELDRGPPVAEMMLMITFLDAPPSIAERDHRNIELPAHTQPSCPAS